MCDNLAETAVFYETILGMHRHADFGWFIILSHTDMPTLEFGLLHKSHETAPQDSVDVPSGVLPTFVVDDVEACYRRAQESDAAIFEPPKDMPYGQRRITLKNPMSITPYLPDQIRRGNVFTWVNSQ